MRIITSYCWKIIYKSGMRVRVLTNNSARFIGGCQTSTGTCTTRGYKFGPEVWMVFRTPDQRTLADSPGPASHNSVGSIEQPPLGICSYHGPVPYAAIFRGT